MRSYLKRVCLYHQTVNDLDLAGVLVAVEKILSILHYYSVHNGQQRIPCGLAATQIGILFVDAAYEFCSRFA